MMGSNIRNLKYINHLPIGERAGRLIWNCIYLAFFRPTPRWVMHSWRRMLLRIFGARIGDGCKVAPSCKVWAPWNLQMGDYSAMGDNVDCYNVGMVIIGSKVAVSQRAFICTATHDTTSLLRPLTFQSIEIHNHAWVAAEAMLMPGVTIGEGTVIAARSLVTKDMPAWYICAGIPCKPKHMRKVNDWYLDQSITKPENFEINN